MEWYFHASEAADAIGRRSSFTACLRASKMAESDCRNAGIVFGELVSNVVRHAPGPIDIFAQSDLHGLISLKVCDSGGNFQIVSPPSLPAPACESGRGLYIVSQLCAHLSSEKTPDGNAVTVVLSGIIPSRANRAPNDNDAVQPMNSAMNRSRFGTAESSNRAD